jgi:type IV secretory pathway component VirB8
MLYILFASVIINVVLTVAVVAMIPGREFEYHG